MATHFFCISIFYRVHVEFSKKPEYWDSFEVCLSHHLWHVPRGIEWPEKYFTKTFSVQNHHQHKKWRWFLNAGHDSSIYSSMPNWISNCFCHAREGSHQDDYNYTPQSFQVRLLRGIKNRLNLDKPLSTAKWKCKHAYGFTECRAFRIASVIQFSR